MRNVISECLGKLVLIDPVYLQPESKSKICSSFAHARSTDITALNFAISDQAEMQTLETSLTKLQKDNAALEDKIKELSSHELSLKERVELTEKEKEEVTSHL
ncbi:unnamed protein product [Larinioides sclopetarius]|uniref:Uncharacterized protein n=1 Tax=Larinioides sclopetarius TaxID=280406 RepID=A0AAV2A1L4_9ARAC